MTLLIGLLIFIAIAVLGGITFLLRKVSLSRASPATAEWLDELSLDRYRPMLRLLDADDLDFLSSQPGVTPGMVAALRVQRTRIFRGYLKSLEADFARVCFAIKLLMVQSKCDRPDLAGALVHQQTRFALAVLMVNVRVLLYRYGLSTGSAQDLIQIFDSMRMELRTLMPLSAVMPA
jgi:hypothetical protein